MRFMEWSKDGGPLSHVDAFFFIEIKNLFSIALLRFREGTRETFHSHAFNAITLWLGGNVIEETPRGGSRVWKGYKLKFTPRYLFHRIRAITKTYALTLRGPWTSSWEEYDESTIKFTKLTNGRKVLQEVQFGPDNS